MERLGSSQEAAIALRGAAVEQKGSSCGAEREQLWSSSEVALT